MLNGYECDTNLSRSLTPTPTAFWPTHSHAEPSPKLNTSAMRHQPHTRLPSSTNAQVLTLAWEPQACTDTPRGPQAPLARVGHEPITSAPRTGGNPCASRVAPALRSRRGSQHRDDDRLGVVGQMWRRLSGAGEDRNCNGTGRVRLVHYGGAGSPDPAGHHADGPASDQRFPAGRLVVGGTMQRLSHRPPRHPRWPAPKSFQFRDPRALRLRRLAATRPRRTPHTGPGRAPRHQPENRHGPRRPRRRGLDPLPRTPDPPGHSGLTAPELTTKN